MFLETALPLKDVADALDVPTKTVKLWIRRGLLPAVNASGRWHVDADAFDQWRTILARSEHLPRLPRGANRTGLISDCIKRALLGDNPWNRSPAATHRHGGSIPTWVKVFPSGRDLRERDSRA